MFYQHRLALCCCLIPVFTAGCGAQPQSPGTLIAPTEEPVVVDPTEAVDSALSRCLAAQPETDRPALVVAQMISVGVPTTLSLPNYSQEPVEWLACGENGVAFSWEGEGVSSFTFPRSGDWLIVAETQGGEQYQAQPLVGGLYGHELRFETAQLNPYGGTHELGALPWPSEFYRAGDGGPISLDVDSVSEWIPDSLQGISGFMDRGVTAGFSTLSAFPLTSAIFVQTTDGASTDFFPDSSDAFAQVGSPAILIELLDGHVSQGGKRFPLIWDYDALAGEDGSVVRNRLTLRLPEGELLTEDADYLFVLTTSLGGETGPWRRSEGFDSFLSEPMAGEPLEAARLRTLLDEAVAQLPDLPSLDVVSSAGHFHTRRFRHELKGIERCIIASDCSDVNLDGGAIPSVQPSFPALEFNDPKNQGETQHPIYWAGTPPVESHRTIESLIEDGRDDTFPLGDYGMIAYGSFESPVFQGRGPDGIRDVFQLDSEGRPILQGSSRLKFTLILPEGPPPEGHERYPVVTFVHGLGLDQSDVFLAAEALAPYGFAVIAIDQVAHGSRYDFESSASVDKVNNLAALELNAPEDGSAGTDEPWKSTGDGLSDARLGGAYPVLSILNFFEWLGNFRAMGDNFRQVAADLYQVERMINEADMPGGLNSYLKSWGATPIETTARLSHGRSLGAIALGVYLPYTEGERSAIMGVPGGYVATHLAGFSPFIGNLLTQVAYIAQACTDPSSEGCSDVANLTEITQESAKGTEFLAPGDPFTHLVQGLLEPGDPAVLAPLMRPGVRSEPAHLGLLHVCKDEIVSNPATYALAEALGAPAVGPAPGVWDTIAKQSPQSEPFFLSVYNDDDEADRFLDTMERQYVQGNGDGGTTIGLLTYCPGTHSGLFDRYQVENEAYGFYPDGPYPGDGVVVFPPFAQRLPVDNAYHESREAMVNFFLTSFSDEAPILTVPAVEQLFDVDSDTEPEPEDKCPYGSNDLLGDGQITCKDQGGGPRP